MPIWLDLLNDFSKGTDRLLLDAPEALSSPNWIGPSFLASLQEASAKITPVYQAFHGLGNSVVLDTVF